MERRKALQAIVFFSVAANAIISCKNKEEVLKNIILKKIKIDKGEANAIDEMAHMIFPTTSIPEFKNHTALPFILTMVDDCYNDADQKIFMKGVTNLNLYTQAQVKKDYRELSSDEQKTILKKINDDQSEDQSELKLFYSIVKDKTIQYYTTTEFYMRKHNLYEMAPGRFLGCIKIEDLQTKNL
jgi:Gluconate 2-dehydrogenase subunit 3